MKLRSSITKLPRNKRTNQITPQAPSFRHTKKRKSDRSFRVTVCILVAWRDSRVSINHVKTIELRRMLPAFSICQKQRFIRRQICRLLPFPPRKNGGISPLTCLRRGERERKGYLHLQVQREATIELGTGERKSFGISICCIMVHKYRMGVLFFFFIRLLACRYFFICIIYALDPLIISQV